MTEPWQAWAGDVLGPHVVRRQMPATARRAGTGQHVFEVCDGQGRRWFLKRAGTRKGWRSEVHAYRHWVPALGSFAPSLLAADAGLRTLVVSALPGVRPAPTDRAANRQAGALLRRLHEARPSRSQRPAELEAPAARVERILARNPALLPPEEEEFARGQAAAIRALPPSVEVPSHGDYLPHNWLVDDAGTLRVFDFGESFWAPPAFDFSKLFYGVWWRRPDLAGAFFGGYGRHPTEQEMAFMQRRMAVAAVAEVAFARRRRVQLHRDVGRARLRELMSGHELRSDETPLERVRRKFGSLVRDLRS